MMAAVALFLAGCRHGGASREHDGSAGAVAVLRIGYQRGDPLNLLKARGTLDRTLAARGIRVEWSPFPAGPQLLEALSVGSIDIGETGESPPIFAQAAGSDMVYVANIPATGGNGEGEAIIVPQNSPIRTPADLRGKRIAFQKASSAHNFVIQVVERTGLSYKDITPVYLAPPDARPAFESGAIDAWAVWDPVLAVAQKRTNARVLVNAKGILTAGDFYLAPRKFSLEHPELLRVTLEQVREAGIWAFDHKPDAARLLSASTGVDVDTLLLLVSRLHRNNVRPLGAEVVRAQQTVADNFFRIGLLPRKLDIRGALLQPAQYAAIEPPGENSADSRAN
jgi:sulfonate transport system substrate-binding protein